MSDSNLRLLIAKNKSWILRESESDRYRAICAPYEVGDLFLEFANDRADEIEWLGQIVERLKQRLAENVDKDGYLKSPEPIQEPIMSVIDGLDGRRSKCGGLYNAAVQQIQDFDESFEHHLFFMRQSLLEKEIENTFSSIQAIVQLQMSIRDALNVVGKAGKTVLETGDENDSEVLRIGNAQLLWRVLKDRADLNELCSGISGYMVVDVNDDGTINEDLLDPGLTNTFRLILNPEKNLLRKESLRNKKVIAEYYEITDPRRLVLIDMVEALRRGQLFACCDSCGNYFRKKDRRRTYCNNPQCSEGKERMRSYNKRNFSDPFLADAYKIKYAVVSRYERVLNASRQDVSKRTYAARKRTMSYDEYSAWLEMFRDEVAKYKKLKEGAILRDDRQAILEKAGRALLDAVRIDDYEGRAKKEENR